MPRPRTPLENRPQERSLRYFVSEDITGRDFIRSFILWVGLEFVSFALFPAIGLINPGPRLGSWFWTSVPLGIGGAFLVGLSSQYIAVTHDRPGKVNKPLYILLGQAVGWLGLAGVLFPLVMMCTEFFAGFASRSSGG